MSSPSSSLASILSYVRPNKVIFSIVLWGRINLYMREPVVDLEPRGQGPVGAIVLARLPLVVRGLVVLWARLVAIWAARLYDLRIDLSSGHIQIPRRTI